MSGLLDAPSRLKAGRALVLIFAFCAWNLTGPAHVSLGLLLLLFLMDLPSHAGRMAGDSAVQLLIAVLVLTSLLAWRATGLLPDIAAEQWGGIWDWVAPFTFVFLAWWIRGDTRLIHWVLILSAVGLLVGMAHKTDWSRIGELLSSSRYWFGFTTLGLGFIVSVILVGLAIFRSAIVGMRVGERSRPLLGWSIWVMALGLVLALLLELESRGAMLGLVLVVLGYGGYRLVRARRLMTRRSTLLAGLAGLVIVGALVWSMVGRVAIDLAQVSDSRSMQELSYRSSTGTRINLYRIGLLLFAQRPILGWGPGTSGTEYLVPAEVIPLSDYHRENAATWSHLHSVPIEILVRFGLVGMLMAAVTILVMARGYRCLWRSHPEDQEPLRHFLLIAGLLALFFGLYDFRYVNVDVRFFLILLGGTVYSYCFRDLR